MLRSALQGGGQGDQARAPQEGPGLEASSAHGHVQVLFSVVDNGRGPQALIWKEILQKQIAGLRL